MNDSQGLAKGSRRWVRNILVLFVVLSVVLIVIPMLVRSCVELAW